MTELKDGIKKIILELFEESRLVLDVDDGVDAPKRLVFIEIKKWLPKSRTNQSHRRGETD